VTAWPSPWLLQQLESTFPIIVLGAGLLTGLLVALMVGFAQTAAQRADEARRAKGVTEQHARKLHSQSQQLSLARDAAINATSAKSQFLATMSHEIRTPMNGVLGTLSLLQDTPLSAEQREYVGQIQSSADTLLRLIDDILDFSKAEAERLTIEEIKHKVIARMLKKLGHEVDVVCNGLEAVEACARGGYDLVLMDCQMPEMDGYAATGMIRQQPGRYGRVPIIALTADASTADRDRCLAAGMDDFLGKPVRPRDLADTLRRWTPVTASDPPAMEHPGA
jgi:CheY-like chemotaxis protein